MENDTWTISRVEKEKKKTRTVTVLVMSPGKRGEKDEELWWYCPRGQIHLPPWNK